MLRASLIAICALFAVSLCADYSLMAREAAWSPRGSKMKQVYIEIARTETTPFSGELELVVQRHDRPDSKYTMGVTMQEGQRRGYYSMQIPSDDDNAGVVVELFGSSERLTPLAQEPVEQSDVSRKYGGADIGFISRSRLAGLNAHLPFNLIEIPVITAPTNWRGLVGFRAIVLNDDRISRAQARALINYATAGGTLIISPRSAASFNPETPAGKLFQVKTTTSPVMAKLSDFSLLLQGKAMRIHGTECWHSSMMLSVD